MLKNQRAHKRTAPNLPIGIFDSGLGGLTVVKEIFSQLSHESIIYFGDTARVPYGTKSKETVEKFSLQILNFLRSKSVKLIVVACNTASAFALDTLKKRTELPVVGVIEPGAKKAVGITKNGRVGIIGTEGTIKSRAYDSLIKKINKKIKVFSRSCPLFVPIVEDGWTDISHKKIVREIAKKYLLPLKRNNIDTLILGCTHYPLIADIIGEVIGDRVNLVDSAKETAGYVKNMLVNSGLVSKNISPKHKFYVSDAVDKFTRLSKSLLGKNIPDVELVHIERY